MVVWPSILRPQATTPCFGGSTKLGASFTAVTLKKNWSESVSSPPLAVPPLSFTSQMTAARVAWALAAGFNFMPCNCARV